MFEDPKNKLDEKPFNVIRKLEKKTQNIKFNNLVQKNEKKNLALSDKFKYSFIIEQIQKYISHIIDLQAE